MPNCEMTFQAIADEYLALSGSRHSESWHKNIRRIMRHDILPQWAEKSITEIRRADGKKLVTAIAARAPRQAATVSAVIVAVFNLALDKCIIETNPMASLRRYLPKPVKRPLSLLTLHEIMAIWNGISDVPGDEACKRAIKAIIVTGQTPGSVTGMHRSEIVGDCWTIPAERCRGGRGPRRVYLSPLALAVIGDGNGFIFGSADGTRHVKSGAVARLIRRINRLPPFGLSTWTVMDLRGSVASHLAWSGVPYETIAAVFGTPHHTRILATSGTYHAAVKAALLLWEAEMLQLTEKGITSPPVSSRPKPFFGL